MPANDFDIYQTEDGYVAVTNDVRRQILAALGKKERQLPELVKLTRKAKPTLSSVHMKELLAQRLVEEVEHPTDKRKKIYRLKARRIGSSNLPVDQLRSVVRQYAGRAPGTLSLGAALDAIAAGIDAAPPEALAAQARRLGAAAAPQVEATKRDLVTSLAGYLEREGVARPLKLDLENHALEMEPGDALSSDAPCERLAPLVGALVEGIARARDLGAGPVGVDVPARRRFVLRLPIA